MRIDQTVVDADGIAHECIQFPEDGSYIRTTCMYWRQTRTLLRSAEEFPMTCLFCIGDGIIVDAPRFP